MHQAHRGAILLGYVTALGSDCGANWTVKMSRSNPEEDILQRTRATRVNILCLKVINWNKNTLYVFGSAGQSIPTTGYGI